MNKSFFALLISQFASAFADNALLFALISYIKETAMYEQSTATPILQMSFILSFVLLAPLVGKSADGFSKGKVLLCGNLIKAFGAIMILSGMNVFASYAIIGIGAAIYSPAKYGILPEITSHDKLVKANGMLEGSTILAILGGAYVGGVLGDINSQYAILSVIGLYVLAAIISLNLIKLKAINSEIKVFTIESVKTFFTDVKKLCVKQKSRVSLFGTAMFWGVGGVLRILMITWVLVVLHSEKLETSSLLSGCVAVGVVIGALFSSTLINFKKMHRVFIPGFLIGFTILLMAQVSTFNMMAGMLVALGMFGGLYVVPLNALLQSEGSHSTGSGQAISIQNFIENIVALSFVGIYLLAIKSGVEISSILYVLSSIVIIFVGVLMYPNWKKLNDN